MCEHPSTGCDNPSLKTHSARLTILMKNTSLFVSFWAMPERKPSADPTECKRARFRALGGSQVIGLKALIASCRQFSECNIIDVATSENCSLENFPCRDVYYVVRSAKQKKDNNLVV